VLHIKAILGPYKYFRSWWFPKLHSRKRTYRFHKFECGCILATALEMEMESELLVCISHEVQYMQEYDLRRSEVRSSNRRI